MSEVLRSNIIIATKLKIEKEGFESAHAYISNIKKRLRELGEKEYQIKINVDPSSFSAIEKLAVAAKELERAGAKVNVSAASVGQVSQASIAATRQSANIKPSLASGQARSSATIKEALGESGALEVSGYTLEDQWKAIRGQVEATRTEVRKLDEDQDEVARATKEAEKNLAQAAHHKMDIREAEKDSTRERRTQAEFDELAIKTAKSRLKQRELESRGFREDISKRKTKEFEVIGDTSGATKTAITATKEYVKYIGNGLEVVAKINEEHNKTEFSLRKSARYAQVKKEIEAEEAKILRQIASTEKEIARETEKEAKARQKVDKQLAQSHKHQQELLRNQRIAASMGTQLLGQGYKEGATSTFVNMKTGDTGQIKEYYRVAKDGLAKYRIELIKVNSLQGNATRDILHGARAAKYLGDGLRHTVEKVLLWTGATSIVFSMIRALRMLGSAASELQANTVFLARVGSNIRGISTEAEKFVPFEEKFRRDLIAAHELTGEIVNLTTVIGGSATEAQRAAAVFLRMGQTKEEALLSVKAALIAARVAELEIAEAADLLSSAMLQFNINAMHILPTLDQLNTLSNNYKVTTDDLLQSISRAGAVMADHNGRLSELAAMTAVVAKRTSRTGTQIGNALKTIQSRLDRIEVRKELSEGLAVSLHEIGGEAKSLSLVLIELEAAMYGMSDAERKNYTLKAAGIRQRNILNAALNDSIEILEAENKALGLGSNEISSYGSALLEARESSLTFEVSMERLKATFTEIAQNVSGPFLSLATTLVNIASALIKIDSLMGGTLSKTALWVGSILIFQKAITFILTGVSALKLKLASVSVLLRTSAYSSNRMNAEIIKSNASAGRLAMTMGIVKALAGDFVSILAATALVTMFTLSSDPLSTMQGIKSLRESELEIAERVLKKENDKVDAVDNTVNALTTLIARKRVLQSLDENEVKNREKIQHIDEMINKVAKASGVKTNGAIDDEKIIIELYKMQANAINDIVKAQDNLIEKKRKAINDLSKENKEIERGYEAYLAVEETRERAKKLGRDLSVQEAYGITKRVALISEDRAKFVLGGGFGKDEELAAKLRLQYDSRNLDNLQKYGYFTNRFKSDLNGITEEYKLHIENQDRIKTLTEEIDKAEKDLTTATAESNTQLDNKIKLLKAQLGIIQDIEKIELYKEERKIKDLFESSFGGSRTREYGKEIEELEKLAKHLDEQIEIKLKTGDEETVTAYTEKLNGLLDTIRKLKAERAKASMEELGEFWKGSFGDRKSMLDDVKSLVEYQRELNKESSQVTPLASMNAMRKALEGEVNRSANRINDISSRMGAFAYLDEEQSAYLVKEERKNMQDLINERAKLEVDYSLKLLDTERKIVLERKKAADEAARSLGILSEEDKSRVIAQAAWFARNPTKKISFEEQFFMDQSSGQIMQRYFAGRMEDFNPTGSQFQRQLAAAGFGMTNELDKALAEIRLLRAGRTDDEIRRQALENSAAFRQASSNLVGQGWVQATGLTSGVDADTNVGGYAQGYNLIPRVQARAMDTQALIDGITGVIEASFEQAENEFTREIKRLESEIRTGRPIRVGA